MRAAKTYRIPPPEPGSLCATPIVRPISDVVGRTRAVRVEQQVEEPEPRHPRLEPLRVIEQCDDTCERRCLCTRA